MRISSRCEYGLRAMVYLAARGDERPVPLPEIAAQEGIPAPFLERILARRFRRVSIFEHELTHAVAALLFLHWREAVLWAFPAAVKLGPQRALFIHEE
ncbi:MAG: Rrf2 family transcriptional regulator, partial [Actinomycetes bacterium]